MKRIAAISALALSLFVLGANAEPSLAPAVAPSTVKVVLSGGHGSGVHIGDGYIVTAAHVVEDQRLIAISAEGGKEQRAEMVLYDKLDDIAVVRIKDFAGVAVSELACRAPKVGEEISVRGNPLNLEFVSAWGRVSGAPRPVGHWRTAMVADLTVLPGNSGGPVFDTDDKVIGIAVGLVGFRNAATTYAFIVPSSTVCRLRDILTTTV